MATPLRLLILEDRPADAELMVYTLRQAGFIPAWQRAETEADYLAHLDEELEVILADYTLPQFDALRALHLLQMRSLDIPFIVVTGAVSEEAAVACMKQGAADYLLKDRLARLGPAVQQALEAKRLRDEKRQAETALHGSEARLRAIVEAAPLPLAMSRVSDGTILYANTHFGTAFGLSPKEAVGRKMADFYCDPADCHKVLNTLSEQGYLPGHELCVKKADGTPFWVVMSLQTMTFDGEPAILAGFYDITQRKHLEAQLHQVQKLEALGTLAGGIAHDFNNILSAILGYTELAQHEVPPNSIAHRHLWQVHVAGGRARDLVQQILAFSRQSDQEQKPVQLNLIVKEALTLLRASLPTTIELRQTIDRHVGTVLADPTQLHQVLLNLCTNAEHAMRVTGGVLEVGLKAIEVDTAFAALHSSLQPGPYVQLTVRDTGLGIEPDILERIFEPFFTTKVPGEGTGMGLAVVHGIIASHGGVITVISTPKRGTTFTIYLPQLNNTAGGEPPHEELLLRGNERILFVDDEIVLARLGQEMLEYLGYEVVTRTSGIEALEAFRAMPQHFDLVITDQTMPQMTGEAFACHLRRIRPDIPIVLCTGFSHLMTAEKAQLLELDAFIMKPLVMRDLGRVIRQVLGDRS